MITTLLKKSSSINYISMAVLAFALFFLYQSNVKTGVFTVPQLVEKVEILVLILASIFLTDFIAKKNNLTKDSGYTIVFYLFLMLFFPSIFNDLNLLISSVLVLIAVRRLISLSNIKNAKEKIFDAAFWIFLASIFHFWSILFIILVFISIIIHDSRDYKIWLLPFVACFCLSILLVFFCLLFNSNLIQIYLKSFHFDFSLDYFTNIYQNVFFSIYITISILFIVLYFIIIPSKSMNLTSSYKKIFAWLIIGFAVFLISNNKNNGILIYTISPLSIMATNYLETDRLNWEKDVVFMSVILFGLVGFILQL